MTKRLHQGQKGNKNALDLGISLANMSREGQAVRLWLLHERRNT